MPVTITPLSRTVRFLLPVLLAVSTYSCPEQGRNDVFFFMVLADPQLGLASGNADWVHEEINLGKAVDAANRLRPQFVIVCGDLTHATGDSAQIDAYRKALARLDPAIPLYQLPGNHDVGNTPTESSLAAYRMCFGRDYYSFQVGFVHGILLNTPLIKDPVLARDERERQDAWLRDELRSIRRDAGEAAMIFQHQPWFVDSLGEWDRYENLPSSDRERYLRMFSDAGISHVFSGHLHRNVRREYEGIQLVASGPVSMAFGDDPPGVRIVRVNGKRVTDEYFALDEIPEKIE